MVTLKLKGQCNLNTKESKFEFTGQLSDETLHELKEFLKNVGTLPHIDSVGKGTFTNAVEQPIDTTKPELVEPEFIPPPPPPLKITSNIDPVSVKWKIDVVYKKGDVVEHNSDLYLCLQDHLSLTNWEPSNTKDVLWKCANSNSSGNQKVLPLEVQVPLASQSHKPRQNLVPNYKIVSVGDVIKMPDALFYQTNNPDVFEILPRNAGVLVLKVGQGCIKFKQQRGYLLDHIVGVFVKGFESELLKRPLIGSTSEDDPVMSIPFWLNFDNYCDLRYTYLSGGPESFGWRLNYSTREYNTDEEGLIVKTFIANSKNLGMTPVFVYKNLLSHKQNMNSIEYMTHYYNERN
jgi:hypothetical protein